MIKRLFNILLFIFILSQNAFAQQQTQVKDIDLRIMDIRAEPDLQIKLKLYEDFKADRKFNEDEDFIVKRAMLEQQIALVYAEKNEIIQFKNWLAKIESPVWKLSTQEQGYKILSRFRADEAFKKEIAEILDPMLANKKPENHDISKFSSYLTLYLKENKHVVNVKVKRYLDYLFNFHEGYFLSDFGFEKKGIPLAETMTLVYAQNLLKERHNAAINELLAKSILAKNFQLSDLDQIAVLLPSLENLRLAVETLIKKKSEGYSGFVYMLLTHKILYQGEKFVQGKQKYLVLDFWGTWCIPCRATHPKLIDLYNRYHPDGVEFISIAREANSPESHMVKIWKDAIEKDGMKWPQVLNNENNAVFDAVKAFSISVFPTKILFDAKYNLIAVYTGVEGTKQLEDKLKELIQ